MSPGWRRTDPTDAERRPRCPVVHTPQRSDFNWRRCATVVHSATSATNCCSWPRTSVQASPRCSSTLTANLTVHSFKLCRPPYVQSMQVYTKCPKNSFKIPCQSQCMYVIGPPFRLWEHSSQLCTATTDYRYKMATATTIDKITWADSSTGTYNIPDFTVIFSCLMDTVKQ